MADGMNGNVVCFFNVQRSLLSMFPKLGVSVGGVSVWSFVLLGLNRGDESG